MNIFSYVYIYRFNATVEKPGCNLDYYLLVYVLKLNNIITSILNVIGLYKISQEHKNDLKCDDCEYP